MSIVPSPGQMGPGAGSIGLALMRHPTLFQGLGMGPALGGLSGVLFLSDLQRARAEGFGNDVQGYRDAMADKLVASVRSDIFLLSIQVMPDHPDKGLSQSSGGGGPGGLPNLHQPPPSIEETGEILSNLPMEGQKIGSPRPSTSKKGRKRRKCPPGYRPVGDKCVRIWGTKHPLYLG
jgi:hypothetical protein